MIKQCIIIVIMYQKVSIIKTIKAKRGNTNYSYAYMYIFKRL